VGLGTTSGISHLITFDFGDQTQIQRSIPTKSIYLENHPFKNNQQIVYTASGTTLSISTDGVNTSNLPSNVFVVNKGKDLIGLKTTVDSEELFFHNNGSGSDLYSFEFSNIKILGDVQKIKTTVSVSTSHGISENDIINLTANPTLSVGIGTSTAVKVYRNTDTDRILLNQIGFNSTGINTSTSIINISEHKFNTILHLQLCSFRIIYGRILCI
jgi:hypothetical protein